MELVKTVHVFCAYATGLGFFIRGLLALWQSPMLKHRVLKILPHVIDTFLLVSGIIMVVTWALWPTDHVWLLAKIIALLLYVYFGLRMLRWGITAFRRWSGFTGGLLVYLYIIGVAHSKSLLSFFGFMQV